MPKHVEKFNTSLKLIQKKIIKVWNLIYKRFISYVYYPNLVIMPVDNNGHQRIDDVSTDCISYGIRSVETMGFALQCMNCSIVLSKRHI